MVRKKELIKRNKEKSKLLSCIVNCINVPVVCYDETSGLYLTDFLFVPEMFIQFLIIHRSTEELKARLSTIRLFLTAALPLDGTFIECQQGNLAFIRMGTALCSADRADSIHVIPTVLRCFNGLLLATITQAAFAFAVLLSQPPQFLTQAAYMQSSEEDFFFP